MHMDKIQRIHLPTHEQKNISTTYRQQTQRELLTVLWGDGQSIAWLTKPKDQIQEEWRVWFDTREIATATKELADAWHAVNDISFFHNHNRTSGHGFDFSQDDLKTAKNLHDTYGVDRMGLVMNEIGTEHIDVQHVIIANHKGDLHDVETDAWAGKVVTMVTDKNWTTKNIMSESIQDAEQKAAQIASLKTLLNAEDVVTAIAA